MKRFTAIFALVTVAIALLAPDSLLGMGMHDCCVPSAKPVKNGTMVHGAHCAHMAMRAAQSSSVAIHAAMQGCCKCCPSVTNANAGVVVASAKSFLAALTQTTAAIQLFPVFYAARIRGERAPPSL